MAKLVRHLTSNEEIVSSNLAEGSSFFFLFEDFQFPGKIFVFILVHIYIISIVVGVGHTETVVAA